MKPLLLLLLLAQTADPAAQLESARAALAQRPKHPRLQYQLAVALAKNGAGDEALAALERLASWGFIYKPEAATFGASPRFDAIVARFADNAKPIGEPQPAFTLDQQGIIAEGLAYDPKRARFFVGGVHARNVFAVDRDGHASTFATLDRGAFGMAVDAKRGVLWVATSLVAEKDAALVELDLRNGRVLATLQPEDKEKHLFGDVTLAADGEVFVSDGASPVIFHVDDDRLTPFARGPFLSLQGLAATNRYLYVSDYGKGLFAIDRKSRDVVLLPSPESASLFGVDGIYLAGDHTLVAVQNGTNPTRVLRLALAPNGLAITGMRILAANHQEMSDVTLGTFARGAFHFIANGGWEAWTDEGKRNENVPLEAVRVMRVEPE